MRAAVLGVISTYFKSFKNSKKLEIVKFRFQKTRNFGFWTRLSKLTSPAAEPRNDCAVFFSCGGGCETVFVCVGGSDAPMSPKSKGEACSVGCVGGSENMSFAGVGSKVEFQKKKINFKRLIGFNWFSYQGVYTKRGCIDALLCFYKLLYGIYLQSYLALGVAEQQRVGCRGTKGGRAGTVGGFGGRGSKGIGCWCCCRGSTPGVGLRSGGAGAACWGCEGPPQGFDWAAWGGNDAAGAPQGSAPNGSAWAAAAGGACCCGGCCCCCPPQGLKSPPDGAPNGSPPCGWGGGWLLPMSKLNKSSMFDVGCGGGAAAAAWFCFASFKIAAWADEASFSDSLIASSTRTWSSRLAFSF